MNTKISLRIAVIILIILPFSAVLSNFSPYLTDYTFQNFLFASFLFAIVSLFLGWFVSAGKLFNNQGFLFFALGLIIAPPLMLGPPEETSKLLSRITEEHFRYGMLMLASLFFAIGFLLIIKNYWSSLSISQKLIIIPLIACFLLLLWDSWSSYNFSEELKIWILKNKSPDDFFPNYNYNVFLRTLGRSLIYGLIPWLGVILWKRRKIKKWQLIVLCIFSAFGVIFFLLTNLAGLQFYFPFMVPAVALAPAYWLGLMLITKKKMIE